jgi:hypothetical protein
VDIESFMKVTGPKTDVWLVKTLSAVLISVALALFTVLLEKKVSLAVIVLGLTSAVALAIAEFYYAGTQRIRWVYAADGVLQVIIAGLWVWIWLKSQKK